MRGHAKGPFGTQSNLLVQNVLVMTPGDTKQLYVTASPGAPVLMRVIPVTSTAITTGLNTLILGTSANDDAYLEIADSTPGTAGIGTEKRFLLVADTNLIAVLSSTAVAASKALTISAITGANTQTVVIGAKTYTFNTSLTDTANNVLIGADVTAMAANLASAINAGAGAGTTYGTGTTANASVTATSSLGVVTVTAITAGTAGNSIAISETLTNGAWAGGATVLSGGSAASTAGEMLIFIEA